VSCSPIANPLLDLGWQLCSNPWPVQNLLDIHEECVVTFISYCIWMQCLLANIHVSFRTYIHIGWLVVFVGQKALYHWIND